MGKNPELHDVLSDCYKPKDHEGAQDAVMRAALGDAYLESAHVFYCYKGSVMKKGHV